MTIQPYIRPSSTVGLPNDLTLTQFIQTVMVGLSGLSGTLVRPKWQAEPPKNPPDITTNWMALGIDLAIPDANGYISPGDDDGLDSQRHETLDVGCSIYGPEALEIYGLIRDGFQIPQNREALTEANMGFVEILPARKIPELVNERFYNRVETSVILRREIIRSYGVPTIISATGVIYAPLSGNADYSLDWQT